MRRLITHVDLCLPDELVSDGSLLVEDDRILSVCPSAPAFHRELDAGGALCLPGLIDLHCDALEKEVEPRPKVAFEHAFALANSDRRNLNAGITTVYHAISFAGGEWGVRDPQVASQVVREVRSFRGLVEHRVHARFEVTDDGSMEPLSALLADGAIDMLSFMDHSPGQGQFSELAAYVAYMTRTYHVSEAEATLIGAGKVESRRLAPARMEHLAALARGRGIALASHDDDTAEKVAAMAGLGVTISEFPIGLAAAKAAVAAGMVTLFGAPNVQRGRSSGGNVRALDVIMAGACTGLCADYHPPSLLAAVLQLPGISPLSLPDAVRLASLGPARAAGLSDRGGIANGQRADLLLVRDARVEAVMVGGRMVLDTVDRTACV